MPGPLDGHATRVAPDWAMPPAVGRALPALPVQEYGSAPAVRRRGGRRLRTVVWLAAVAVLSGFVQYQQMGHRSGGPGSDRPPAGAEEAAQPLGRPAPPRPGASGAATSHTFMITQADGTTPVTFDPCRPIHWVVNPANEPAGAQDVVVAAFAAAGQATGLRFIYDGTTDEAPVRERSDYQPQRYPGRWAPVLVAFGDPQVLADGKTREPNVIGMGGPDAVDAPDGRMVYVSGEMVLSPDDKTAGAWGVRLAAVEHELGHIIGLDHVPDPTQIMNTYMSPNLGSYQSGDLAGLAVLGSGPCEPDL